MYFVRKPFKLTMRKSFQKNENVTMGCWLSLGWVVTVKLEFKKKTQHLFS
jgi:hypothetical protein